MIDSEALLADLQALVRELEDDIRAHLEENAESKSRLEAEYAAAKQKGRTGLAPGAFRDEQVTQAAVAWVLACVFVRFLEDNDLVAEPLLTGPAERGRRAKDRQTLFFQRHPHLADRDYLLDVIAVVAALPGMQALLDSRTNPLFRIPISADGATKILAQLRRVDPGTGGLEHDFTDPEKRTRFLGDLYQDLSAAARKTYALLQTPEFVQEFMLDRTLDPAIDEFGLADTNLIDPACGSGHFLLGAFDRMLEGWCRAEPAVNVREHCQRALDRIAGVDVNPFAIAIARFRLLVAALVASNVRRLSDAPDFRMNLAVGDSLLFGDRPRHGGGVQRSLHASEIDHYFNTEDADTLKRVLKAGYAVVVGNPPYITPKDPVLREAYRERFDSCHGKYSLVVPFIERFIDLARYADRPTEQAGYVGMLVSDSFMKREFGKKLIEDYLPKKDLTHVISLSGAYIPGNGTPSAILVARARTPTGNKVRGVLSIRGEPGTPEIPAQGKVWTEIVASTDNVGFVGAYVSVTDLDRGALCSHPWSIGGGGAAELKEIIDSSVTRVLRNCVDVVGVFGMTNADEILIGPSDALLRSGVESTSMRRLTIGDDIRDWVDSGELAAVFPYVEEELAEPHTVPGVMRFLWPARTTMGSRATFGGSTYFQEDRPWWEWHQVALDRLRTPLSITFAFVATHNHFVLDRGGKVFNRSAPVIKLPANATEEDHLGLLGLLNSSTACFWGRQTFYPKGGFADGKWEERLEWDGTKLLRFPIPAVAPLVRARLLQQLSENRTDCAPHNALAQRDRGSRLRDLRARSGSELAAMIAEQEELDWECYRLYGLLDAEVFVAPGSAPPLRLGERAFEIVMARKMAAGELETKWFERHGSTPITELPAHWPKEYSTLVERRIALIESHPHIALIEQPEYKRRWNVEPWEEQEQRALRAWLLDRIESRALWPADAPKLVSCAQLADRVRGDADFAQVAEMYAKRADFDLTALVRDLVLSDAVPYLPVLRYTPSGLRKREDWERTWDLQRNEDAIDALGLSDVEARARKKQEVGDIPVPPKYASSDFQKSTYWNLRGKLDVPKERFVLYPFAEREVDPSPVITWAGYDHLQQARALAECMLSRKDHDGWTKERLQPLLLGVHELVPWLKQWHNAVDPHYGMGMGTYFEQFVREEARALGLTVDALKAWVPPAGGKRGRLKKA
ncbi:MAG: BREX-2 system adenine-specific DNA-methyltransferase PglX [Planctomycetes bacterium]|nr:BREX-2 system adenine-specific DNA-methyltransferase PglX [Planctomycetota bacterium]